jgi:hypothetical protein
MEKYVFMYETNLIIISSFIKFNLYYQVINPAYYYYFIYFIFIKFIFIYLNLYYFKNLSTISQNIYFHQLYCFSFDYFINC